MAKYNEFEVFAGANYLFKNYGHENDAILTAQAVMVGLPFERKDINKIAHEIDITKTIYNQPRFAGKVFKYFSDWILSKHCAKSRLLVKKSLSYFQDLLDKEGEMIAQPYFPKHLIKELEKTPVEPANTERATEAQTLSNTIPQGRRLGSIISSTQQLEESPAADGWFYILFSSKKRVVKGEDVVISGGGFLKKHYKFKLGLLDTDIQITRIIDDKYVRIVIPATIEIGTYDLFASYKYTSGRAILEKETEEAIVIHVCSL